MDEQEVVQSEESISQLTQKRVPLHEAMLAFGEPDANGSIPIVLIPDRVFRLQIELIALGVLLLLGGVVGTSFLGNSWLVALAVVLGILVIFLAVYRSLYVRVPEGANALLARAGKYSHTIGSGGHIIPPWLMITHLVTRREIPFDVPVIQAPTKDNVRANVDTLITFTITDPYRFVYNISADDFDRVFQAACQDGLRAMVRQITTEEVNDLVRRDLTELRQTLSGEVEPYGIAIMKVNITYAQPPADFMRSQEARQLAIYQQAEQAETQALALRRQVDEAILARQRVIARVEQEREELQLEIQRAEARRRVIELEAEAEALRLARLQERLRQFPEAARWDWQGEQLNVARALAGNARAVVQFGEADALVRALLLRDMAREEGQPASEFVRDLLGGEVEHGA